MVVTVVVLMVKLADEEFAGIVIELGTDAAGLALERLTSAPADGVGPVRFTVPVALCPPVIVDGFKPTELKLGCDVCAGL